MFSWFGDDTIFYSSLKNKPFCQINGNGKNENNNIMIYMEHNNIIA